VRASRSTAAGERSPRTAITPIAVRHRIVGLRSAHARQHRRVENHEGWSMTRIRLLFVLLAALLLTACASSGSYGYRDDGHRLCRACGVVERLERVEGGRGYASGSGALLGAIIGGALGNQVGKGDGRKAATIAGAVAGGVIGNEIEKEGDGGTWYEVFVRFDDGSRRVIRQRSREGIREGDRVYVESGRARLL
jgi:outer membrane lipoprotein SlyB